jgi:hypothetical protein
VTHKNIACCLWQAKQFDIMNELAADTMLLLRHPVKTNLFVHCCTKSS